MQRNVFVISTSPRKGGNSEVLADAFIKGASEAGHHVEKVTLYNKTIQFCKGCLSCQQRQNGHCIMRDDGDQIVHKMAEADVIVFATPVYFYAMCGQMKTLLDRTNPLFPIDYTFRDIYLIATAAERDISAMDGVIKELQGWMDCFEHTKLQGIVYGIGVDHMQTIYQHPDHIQNAYVMGKNIKSE